MLVLPKTIGSLTLERKIGTGNVAEAYLATQRNGKPALVRRILPFIARDPARLAAIEARVNELAGFRHPALVHVIGTVEEGGETFMVEDRVDGVSLERVIVAARTHNSRIPANLFLHIAVQVCNALEALHSRPSPSGADSTLHLGVKPGAVFVAHDGKVTVGSFGLTRSPTSLPQGGVASAITPRMEYLSPEQTHADQQITPSSDLFSLGAVLYELLTQESLFRAESNLQTIHRIRRGEVTSQLLRVKARMPGLDKVLYRALSVNPKHRYQRAFVLREDLRGLMSGYSFASLPEDAKEWLAPLFDAQGVQPTPFVPAQASYSGSSLDTFDSADAPEDTDVGFAAADADLEVSDVDLPVAPKSAAVTRLPDPTASSAGWVPVVDGPSRKASLIGLSDDEAAPENTAAWIAPSEAWQEHSAEQVDEDAAFEAPESTAGFLAARDLPMHAAPPLEEPTQTSPGEPPEVERPAVARPAPRLGEEEAANTEAEFEAPPPQSKVFSLAIVGGLAAMLICSGGVYGAYTWALNARAERVAAAMQTAAPPIVAASNDPAATMADLTPLAPPADAQAEQAQPEQAQPEQAQPEPARASPAPVAAAQPEAPPQARSNEEERRTVSPQPAAPQPAAPQPAAQPSTRVEATARPAAAQPSTRVEATARPEPVPQRTVAAPTTPPPITRDAAIPGPAPRPTGMIRPTAPVTASVPSAAAPADASLNLTPAALNFDSIATDARAGRLRSEDAAALSALPVSDPGYTRAQALLLSNAEKKGDGAAAERALQALFTLPENTYNPQFLAADARYQVNKGQYDKALARAQTAERYWSRLPPSQSFATRTQIYEVEAAAWQGKFYGSNADMTALDNAIRGWNRYREHVASANRADLEKSAEAQITKLEDIRVRLQE